MDIPCSRWHETTVPKEITVPDDEITWAVLTDEITRAVLTDVRLGSTCVVGWNLHVRSFLEAIRLCTADREFGGMGDSIESHLYHHIFYTS